jgi:hypothetical protein
MPDYLKSLEDTHKEIQRLKKVEKDLKNKEAPFIATFFGTSFLCFKSWDFSNITFLPDEENRNKTVLDLEKKGLIYTTEDVKIKIKAEKVLNEFINIAFEYKKINLNLQAVILNQRVAEQLFNHCFTGSKNI